jgi:hypothetical protein
MLKASSAAKILITNPALLLIIFSVTDWSGSLPSLGWRVTIFITVSVKAIYPSP